MWLPAEVFFIENMVDRKRSNEDETKSAAAARPAIRIVPETGMVHESELRGGLRPLTDAEIESALPGTFYTVPTPDGRETRIGWVSVFGPKPGGWGQPRATEESAGGANRSSFAGSNDGEPASFGILTDLDTAQITGTVGAPHVQNPPFSRRCAIKAAKGIHARVVGPSTVGNGTRHPKKG